jgi:phosphoribosyl 1,2-cyclic phosphodiesterase
MARLSYKFWGVRGSLPSAGATTVRYGGNTPCLEVRCDDHLFIVDMGSGLRALGAALGFGPLSATVLMTHYHYDHIQGLPFFGPIFNPKNKFEVYGPEYQGQGVRDVLGGQLIRPYFPVGLEILRAELTFKPIAPGEVIRFGDATIRTCDLFHPGGSLGYRFEVGGKSLVYCTDAEHDDGPMDRKLTEFASGADAFILDAMYTPEEYEGKVGGPRVGFGHSTYAFATRVAREAGVKHLVLCHHDPGRTDDQLDALVKTARERFAETTAARELELVEL